MKKFIYASLICATALGGCEKFLDKTDPTATKFNEFFNTEEDLRRVVYSSMTDVFSGPGLTAKLPYMEDGKSDNAYSRTESHHHQLIANGNFNSNTQAFLYYYELHMKHLGRLNVFIANADLPYVEDEAVRAKYKGVLEGIRCLHYFWLVSRWENVPFYLEPADIESATQPSKTKDEILSVLFPMAEEIANKLPPQTYTADSYMFNKFSLKAVIMRYYLYFGRYADAARLAKEIMDSGKYELHPNYGDLFQYKADKTNKEFIFTMDMESHSNSATNSFQHLAPQYRTGNGQSFVVPLKSLVDAYWTLQGDPIDKSTQYTKEQYELNPKLNRDPRLAASIYMPGDMFATEAINIYDPNNPMYYENARASRSGFWFRKFVDQTDAFKTGGNMHFPYLRYAEVLLTYAEAKIMLNQVDALAKQCINDVRRRAGLDMAAADVTLAKYAGYTQQQWTDLIRNERRIELAGEGRRYDDIIRWRIAEKVLNEPALGHTRMVNGQKVTLKIEDRTFRPNNYLWPFHENSLKVEPGLKQNPGY
ncbi:RagB/SusD family nutrient uptake outer membrane protein [Chitinophaga sp. NPDC101104]|uniref:RagB/SusD family nutrient uptake outer membrane protein n=1 Tax=Chitinophaga sp. NPDC101104 TaxID=3390561 RepID=UPI003D0920E1